MTLKTNLGSSITIDTPDTLPVARMRVGPAAAVTLDADIPVGMTGLTRLQVAPRLNGMFAIVEAICLTVGTQWPMGLDPQIASRKFGMTLGAVLRVVASPAALRIVGGLDWMDVDPIAAMAFRLIVAAKVLHRQVVSRAPAGMAVEAELLFVTLAAVLDCLARQCPVASHPVAVVVRSDTFRLVALGTLRQLHLGVFLVSLLLGYRLMNEKT